MSANDEKIYILNPTTNNLILYDALTERLCKAEALLHFITTEFLSEHFNTILRNYLWTLSQLIQEALELNEALFRRQFYRHTRSVTSVEIDEDFEIS